MLLTTSRPEYEGTGDVPSKTGSSIALPARTAAIWRTIS
jgi:hypothetical protein